METLENFHKDSEGIPHLIVDYVVVIAPQESQIVSIADDGSICHSKVNPAQKNHKLIKLIKPTKVYTNVKCFTSGAGQDKRYVIIAYNDSQYSIIRLPDYSIEEFIFERGIVDISYSLPRDQLALLSYENEFFLTSTGKEEAKDIHA